MNFSPEWEVRYQQHTHMSIWPWSDLVSYVMRHARPTGPGFRVLELGCGAGANIPLFLSLGMEYFAIEGSSAIVEQLWLRYPTLKENIAVGDFTRAIPFGGDFSLVVDRASLTHNATSAISRCLDLVHGRLKPGGSFIGIDWFSTAHSEYGRGAAAEDGFTRTGYNDGPYADVGRVHYSDKAHLFDLFKRFEIRVLEHKIVQREIPTDDLYLASWNLVARKV